MYNPNVLCDPGGLNSNEMFVFRCGEERMPPADADSGVPRGIDVGQEERARVERIDVRRRCR